MKYGKPCKNNQNLFTKHHVTPKEIESEYFDFEISLAYIND